MFTDDLQIGHRHQELIQQAFKWNGVFLQPTQGKHSFDFYLPNGQALECKLDLMSLLTGRACIEYPSIARQADLYAHTICYTKVFTFNEYKWLYDHGKMVKVGDQKYDGRVVSRPDFRSMGKFIDQIQ